MIPPLTALIVQEEQEFLVMLTFINWFVSLFHTLLKVGQSLDVLENPSSVPATFLTDNNPSCYTENVSAAIRYAEDQSPLPSRHTDGRVVAIWSLHRESVAWKEWNL